MPTSFIRHRFVLPQPETNIKMIPGNSSLAIASTQSTTNRPFPNTFLTVRALFVVVFSLCIIPSAAFLSLGRPRVVVRPNQRFLTMAANPLEELGLPNPLLLGSASFTRKLILKEMGIPFVKVVRPIDEKALGDRSQDPPQELVLTLAKAKMDHLVTEIKEGRCQQELPQQSSTEAVEDKEWIILTGDQVVTCDGKILEKPETIEEAREFVAYYRTHPPSTVGSCVLTHLPSGIQVAGVDTATIYFHSTIPTDLVDRLVELNEPILSCAGGLMIEHPLTKEHLDRIDGTEDSVMGLSKDLVMRLLKELKEQIPSKKP